MKKLFDVRNLCFAYHKKPLCLNDISVVLLEGQKVMVLGDDDSGKTTFLKAVSSFDDTYFGQIFYDGKDIKKYTDEEKNFSLLLSEPVLLNSTIEKNIDFLCEHLKKEKLSQKDIEDVCEKFLLKRKATEKIKKLTLCEKRKLAMIRAWIKNSDVVFFDDQFIGLDENEQKEMLGLYEMFLKTNKTVVFAVSPKTFKENETAFKNLKIDRIVYLSFSKSFEFKNIEEFFEKKTDFNVLKFSNDFVFEKGCILRNEGVYYYQGKTEVLLKFDKVFYDKLSMLSLQNDEEEEVFVCFDKKIVFDDTDNENFNKSLKNHALWIFSAIDYKKII